MADEMRVGMYICSGCDIGTCLDIDKLSVVASEELNIPICRTHPMLCSPEGIQLIQADIKHENLTGISLAACSPRVKTDVFTFEDSLLVDRINLREQVAWSHAPQDEETQMLAEDSVRMGYAKLKTMKPVVAYHTEVSKIILVVGGGIAGLTAAIGSARAGYDVVLVEKESVLGGWMGRNVTTFPTHPPYTDNEEIDYSELIKKIQSHPRITLHLSSTIEKISGQPGQFDVIITTGASAQTVRIGAIILATGWKPYDASHLGHLGYGRHPDVITNVELEEMARSESIRRRSDGKDVTSVVFVQCAGSRDPNHLPYCSGVCCNVTLKQTRYIREHYPRANIYIIYKDMRTPDQHELFYVKSQEDERVFYTKGNVTAVEGGEDGSVVVDVDETLIGDSIRIKTDMVVLAVGMVPTTKVEALDEDSSGEVPLPDDSGKTASLKDHGASAEEGAGILNLDYRLGTDLPTLKYGFPDSHYICFPYETRRTGIYAAGCVRAPQDADSSAADARGAALKAIQSVECAALGQAVHPRSGDLAVPDFFLQRCTQCKRCTEECPFGTLNEDEKGTPQLNILRCRRCGICLGACPERIISFPDFSIEMVAQMIKAIDMPDEFEEKPRILAFVCENDAYPLLDIMGEKRIQYSPIYRIIPVRCLGAVNVIWIGDSLSSGFDGILLLGCKHGDDYQCHYIRGSELAGKRMENVQEKLQQLALEPERVRVEEISLTEWDKLPDIVNEFADEIAGFGLNPYKGF